MDKLKISVIGLGYVGSAISVALSVHHPVVVYDIVQDKVEKINRRIPPVQDEDLKLYLAEKDLDLTATTDEKEAYQNADFIIIAVPTNVWSSKKFCQGAY